MYMTTPIAPTGGEIERARDWTEDFAHENGNYQNTCQAGALGGCGKTFTGHKRRVICKACSQRSEKLGAMLEAAREKVENMTPIELALRHADQSASFIRGEFPESADAFLAKSHIHTLAAALRTEKAKSEGLEAVLRRAHNALRQSKNRIHDTNGPSSWLCNVSDALDAVEAALQPTEEIS